MSSLTSDFVHKFHHLDGVTIGERTKELFVLLHEYESLGQNDQALNDVLQNLKPTTYLQRKLLVDILIHFRRYPELLDVFRGENEALIKKLWGQVWFFRRLLQENSATSIVNELFRHLSYVTRMRFLKKIIYFTADEERVDEFHDLVMQKYGSSNANLTLVGCSLKKLVEVLNNRKTKFNNEQLLFLYKYKKYHLSKLMQLEHSKDFFDFYDTNSKALSIIAGSDFKFFSAIVKDNRCSSVGKRLTRKLLSEEREYVLHNASSLLRSLHKRTMLKHLKSDYKTFFYSSWPRSFKNFNIYSCSSLMEYYPKKKRLALIQEGLHQVYGKSLANEPYLIKEELLEYTEDIQMRESLLEIKMRDSKEDYTLAQYYDIKKSIPILKKKISAADGVTTRENLIKALVDTCKVNNDIDALLDVQKYFIFRHKNDDESIRSAFLTEIVLRFDLTKLTNQHWQYILELMKWNEIKDKQVWGYGEIFMKYIRFIYKNDGLSKTIENFLSTHINHIMNYGNKFKIFKDIPELQKYILMIFTNNFLSKTTGKDEQVQLGFELFEVILDWNQKHSDDVLDFLKYPLIKESIGTTLKTNSRKTSEYIKKFITGEISCQDTDFLEEIKNIFWLNLDRNFDCNSLEHLLRRNPSDILKNFDTFISVFAKEYLSDSLCIWRLLKHYDHLDLPQKAVAYLKENEMEGFISIVGMGLATLMDPLEYLKMMPVPEAEKVNNEDGEQLEKYRLICSLLESTKYLNASSVLPIIVEFCKGDYLHSALTPLYHFFFHTAEKHQLSSLQILSTRAVSVRKHAVKLACSVSPIEIISSLMKQMTDTEKNQSAIEHLFRKTFKYFLIDQSDELWTVIQRQIKRLDIMESHAFKEICSIKEIPLKYQLSHLNFLWEILDDLENQGKDISDLKQKLIESLTPNIISELPYEFCSNLIKEKFMRFGDHKSQSLNSFALNCIKYSQQKELILKDIFTVIGEFKRNYILNSDFDISHKSRSYITVFMSSIYYDFLNDKNINDSIITQFLSYWLKIFTPRENIKDYIHLVLLVELTQINELNTYVLKFSEIFDRFVSEFGILGILDCFTDDINYILPDTVFGSDDIDVKKFRLALELLESQSTVHIQLLIIHLLPKEIPDDNESKKMFLDIIEKLKSSDDNSVHINLNLYLT